MTSQTNRGSTERGRLVRRGFVDPQKAIDSLTALWNREFFVGSDEAAQDEDELLWVDAVCDSADPDLALDGLVALAPRARESRPAWWTDEVVRARLTSILGASQALGEHLARHPDQIGDLVDPLPLLSADQRRDLVVAAVGGDATGVDPVAGTEVHLARDALRVEYRRQLVQIAAADLHEGASLPWVAEQLADLASAALEGALSIARAEVEGSERCRLAVIGMGKCGGRELNYISDVDVIFVAEPADGVDEQQAMTIGAKLAGALIHACGDPTAEGSLWEVDAALRPEGKSGALVRTLRSHVAYYEKWASTWEFQALLKARPVAGDRALGEAYVEAMAPMVWAAASRKDFVSDLQAMRRRVEQNIPAKEAGRQLKLGPGGLRDVEFSVQLLQLVHGRDDFRLRSATTLNALEALSTHGFVGRDDAAELDRAYQFLRTMEHRIQLVRLRRTHIVPDGEADLRRLGRSMGFRVDPVEELLKTWRGHQREVRRLHEKLFYRPLLDAVARLEPGEARLTLKAAQARLEALGFADPAGALRHIEALTSGISRRATVQKTLLPVMLAWFADSPDPDAGLLAFRQVSDALGSTPWYLRLLRDEGATAERMARVLGSSGYAADLLLRAPEATVMFGDDDELVPRPIEALVSEACQTVHRQIDSDAAIALVRAIRRRELLRTSIADVLGTIEVDEVCQAISGVATAVVESGLEAAIREVERHRGEEIPTRIAVIAMGRFGGRELSYGSDADVLFVHEPLDGADETDAADAALAVANELTRLLAIPAPDPPLLIDADLRPEGRQGPLVRSIASYAAYYARWSLVWESQALLRAEPVAGDSELGRAFIELIDPLRYPEGGLSAEDLREVRRVKARVENERLPRGADPKMHTKLGPGGLADVEWTLQLLQLQHGHRLPGLRTTSTTEGLAAAREAGLITAQDAEVLLTAWRTATGIRNAVMLSKGRASDSIPTQALDRARLSRLMGYEDPRAATGRSADLVEDYLRVTRRARVVVERVFYG